MDGLADAACAACRDALRKGGTVLLEPIVRAEITCAEAYHGSVVGDLGMRRCEIVREDLLAGIVATVPFCNMIGYAAQLASFSQATGRVAMALRA